MSSKTGVVTEPIFAELPKTRQEMVSYRLKALNIYDELADVA